MAYRTGKDSTRIFHAPKELTLLPSPQGHWGEGYLLNFRHRAGPGGQRLLHHCRKFFRKATGAEAVDLGRPRGEWSSCRFNPWGELVVQVEAP